MLEYFKIPKCTHKGCINNRNSKCTLDSLPIERFAEHLTHFQDSNVCLVRQQVNVFRTETLIENK
jgi:hypothetical protein